jgi:hypothetical protein
VADRTLLLPEARDVCHNTGKARRCPMDALQEVERLLGELPRAEKAQVL